MEPTHNDTNYEQFQYSKMDISVGQIAKKAIFEGLRRILILRNRYVYITIIYV